MTELLEVKSTMSSLEIAELTGKRHDAILRDIRNLLSQGVAAHNFVETSYKDKSNKSNPCYNLTKKGCLILASGYNAKLREKIIDRWEELETEKRNGGYQVPNSFSEALLLAAKQQEQIEQQQKQIEHKQATIEAQTSELKKQAPKVEYYDQTLQSVNTLTATQVAKERGMDAEKLNRKLKEAGIIYRQSGQWIVKQPYASWGLHKTRTQTFTRSDGSLGTNTYLVWTQRGKMFILALADNDFKVKDAVRQIKGAAATAKSQQP